MSLCEENKRLNEEETARLAPVLRSLPRSLMIILTMDCNLRCIMCPRQDGNYELPFPVFEKLEPVYPFLETINWGGGDVFNVGYFKQLFRRAASFPQIRHYITTNALLIDDEWAELLVRSNVHLSCSIDSVIGETYESIRLGGRFADLRACLDRIRRGRTTAGSGSFRASLDAVVMRRNFRELLRFPAFCQEYGFDQLRLGYLRPVVDPAEDIFTEGRDEGAIEYVRSVMPQLEVDCRRRGIELDSCLGPFLNRRTETLQRTQELVLRCRLPWSKLLIDGGAKGRVTPDCHCRHELGNILDHTIEELWNGEAMQDYRRRIAAGETRGWCSDACLLYERRG